MTPDEAALVGAEYNPSGPDDTKAAEAAESAIRGDVALLVGRLHEKARNHRTSAVHAPTIYGAVRHNHLADDYTEAADVIERLTAEVERLRGALRPFSDAAQDCDDEDAADTLPAWESPMAMAVTLGTSDEPASSRTRGEGDGAPDLFRSA